MSVFENDGFKPRYYKPLSVHVKRKFGGFCALTTTAVISILFVRILSMTKTHTSHIIFCLVVPILTLIGCNEHTAYRYLDVAVMHEGRGDYETALTAFQAAVDTRPEDVVLRRWLGRAYFRRNQYSAAQAEFEIALGLAPDYLILYRDLAVINEAQNMPEAAVGWLEQAVAHVPQYEDSHRDLIGLYLANDQLSDAQTHLESVIEQWPEAMWAHFQLGGLYRALKWSERAEASFTHILDFDPQNEEDSELLARAHAELGNLAYDREDYQAAEGFYKKALEHNPVDDSSMNNLAWIYAVQGIHLREGMRLSRRSLRLRPQAPSYMDTLAELYYKVGDTERAIQIIRQAIALDPDNPELRAHLHKQLAKFLSGGQGKV
jgi:tetratricopeptide (TPR) repeat protein